jgi:ribonuclease-3
LGLDALEARLGHSFHDPSLLRQAMCHRSWVAEVLDGDEASNERLEFLGDAVLGWVVADLVYRDFADLAEGALTDLRKSVVNANALAGVARNLGLGEHLLLGRGEDAAGGRDKTSILSDAIEAVFGAVYLDGGRDAAFALIERLFSGLLDDAVDRLHRLDHKSTIQEILARDGRPAPEYQVSSSGPDHAKHFIAKVYVDRQLLGRGEGRSKKSAEQAAASAAYEQLVESVPTAD